MLAAGDDRQHGGNDGYDDEPAIHYSWDSTVPNHRAVTAGDKIAIRNKRILLGASVVEEIETHETTKPLYGCPACGLAGIKPRKTLSPRFKCYKCKEVFDEPSSTDEPVTTYRSRHDVGWIDLGGCLSGAELRALCVHPTSQLSLRQLRWPSFRAAVARSVQHERLTVLDAREMPPRGGHRQVAVRVRRGQATFRKQLLEELGPTCAFTGPAPPSALEAGHLYSYATVGEHHEHGGFLLRRDVHRLFDLGHLAVDPQTMTVDVAQSLLEFPAYASLAGRRLEVPVKATHKRWLADHWREHRLLPEDDGLD